MTYVRAIRKNWWIVLVAALLGGGAATAVVLRTPPTYATTFTYFVNTTPSDSVNPLQSDQYAQDRVNSYVKLMSSERLASMVLEDTNLPLTPQNVMSKISATSDLNTVLMTATVEDSSPDRSYQIATSAAEKFDELVATIDPTVHLELTSRPFLVPYPVAPNKKLDIGLGLVGGILLGAAVAIGRELLNTTVRSRRELEELTELPVVGSIPFDAQASKTPLLIDEGVSSVRAEALRQLRTNLRFADFDHQVKVIVVTSAVAGEGKSTTATNLAITLALGSSTVLLIEADMRRPRVADYLGIDQTLGLSNVLASQISLDDVVQPWGDSGLDVLASGSPPPNPSELLGSHNMAELCEQLRQRYDFVIIDTPPLLPVTDAAVAGAFADGVLLVVRSGKTKRQHLAIAVDALRSVDARILGTVFSMVPKRSGVNAYYGTYEATSSSEGVTPDANARRFLRNRRRSDLHSASGSSIQGRGHKPAHASRTMLPSVDRRSNIKGAKPKSCDTSDSDDRSDGPTTH